MISERIKHGITFLVLFLVACFIVWLHRSVTPQIVLAVERMYHTQAALPGGLHLVLNAGSFVWCLPVAIGVLFAISFKLPRVRSALSVSIIGSLLTLILAAFFWLLLSPLFGVNLDYASNRFENTFPPEIQKIFESARGLELYSLTPEKGTTRAATSETFHGYIVLGKLPITETNQMSEVVNAILEGIKSSDGRVAMCFSPRHGLRVVSSDGEVDLVICFECRKIETHLGSQKDAVGTTLISKAVINGFLQKAGIQLDPEK